mgnify:FL=1
MKIAQFNNVVMRAEMEKEPSIISDYTYNLAQAFSSFYNSSPIKGEESSQIAQSRIALAELTRNIMVKLLFLLGIEAPEIMPKA